MSKRQRSTSVDEALRLKLDHDRRRLALAAYLETYEAAHGAFTPDEMRAAERRARARALAVRPPPTATRS